ncbi:MAG: polysaccharide biosynthesis protein [Bacilli bacterium]|nr:polysaccharide biosynthesis protein [Bacilli bacterium]
MKNKKILFIASTGGHLNELLQLEPLFKKYDSYIVTENTKSNKSLKQKYPKKVNFLISGSYTSFLSKILYPFKLFINCWISLYLIIKVNPSVVITTGAHNVGPMCCLAKLFRKKLIFIETFANSTAPTKTGKIVYKFADVFIVQWESMLEFYPNAIYGGWIY